MRARVNVTFVNVNVEDVTSSANIATGQLRKCVSTQQVSLLSRPRFLELGGGGQYTLRAPPAKKFPPPGSRTIDLHILSEVHCAQVIIETVDTNSVCLLHMQLNIR